MNPGDLVGSPYHEIQSYTDWPYHATYPQPSSFTVSPKSVGVYISNRSNQHGDVYWLTLFSGHIGWIRDTWLVTLDEALYDHKETQ